MTTTELIEKLKSMPPNAQVGCVWDGALRTIVRFVWHTKDGCVALADYNAVVYSEEDRPIYGPSVKEEKRWSTPENPNPEEY